jgi:hypothetical protein
MIGGSVDLRPACNDALTGYVHRAAADAYPILALHPAHDLSDERKAGETAILPSPMMTATTYHKKGQKLANKVPA